RRQSAAGQRLWRCRVGVLLERKARSLVGPTTAADDRRADRSDRSWRRFDQDRRPERRVQLLAGAHAHQRPHPRHLHQRRRYSARRDLAEGRRLDHWCTRQGRDEDRDVQQTGHPLLHLQPPPLDVWADRRGMMNASMIPDGGASSRRPRLSVALALSCMLLGTLVPARAADAADPSAATLIEALLEGREPVGAPFDLIDQRGRRRTDVDFRGKLVLIYFGYTHCPDVCPTELQALSLALDMLGTAAEAVQPLFITIDPER